MVIGLSMSCTLGYGNSHGSGHGSGQALPPAAGKGRQPARLRQLALDTICSRVKLAVAAGVKKTYQPLYVEDVIRRLEPGMVQLRGETAIVHLDGSIAKGDVLWLDDEEKKWSNRLRLENYYYKMRTANDRELSAVRESVDKLCATLPPTLQPEIMMEVTVNLGTPILPHTALKALFTRFSKDIRLKITEFSRDKNGRRCFMRMPPAELVACVNSIISVLEAQCRQGYVLDELRTNALAYLARGIFFDLKRLDFHDLCTNMYFEEKEDTARDFPDEPRPCEHRELICREVRLVHHLATMCIFLHTLILPFASDSILQHVAACPALRVFQCLYRSPGVTDRGVRRLVRGRARNTLTSIQLRLSSSSARQIRRVTIKELLWNLPRLAVLDFSDSCKCHPNYRVGGGAELTMEIPRCLEEMASFMAAAAQPQLSSRRFLLQTAVLYGEMGKRWNPEVLVEKCPNLNIVHLYTWHGALYWTQAWMSLSWRLQVLELVGTRHEETDFQYRDHRRNQLDFQILSGAIHLKHLNLSNWMDSQVDLNCLLATFPYLTGLILEDTVVNTTSSACWHNKCVTAPHRQALERRRPVVRDLQLRNCATNNPNLGFTLPRLFPHLTMLCIDGLLYENVRWSSVRRFQDRPESHQQVFGSLLQMARAMPKLATIHIRLRFPERERGYAALIRLLFWDKAWPSLSQIFLFHYSQQATKEALVEENKKLREMGNIFRPGLYLEIN